MSAERVLSRAELTAALAARQLLLERVRLSPAEAIARLTPLQGQDPPSPHIALAARLEGFARADLEAAFTKGTVVKTTIMRQTLHVAAAADYPAYAQLSRQARMRTRHRRHPDFDFDAATGELREWFSEPRDNGEIRAFVAERWPEYAAEAYTSIGLVRDLLPLVQLPPAGFWRDPRRSRFAVDPRPLPDPPAAAEVAVRRHLAAYGPASLRDLASWAGVAQRDLSPGIAELPLVSYRDEAGTELLDLPDAPVPPASTPLPVRFFGRWEQPLLAYADRERIIPAELAPLKLTLSGDQTVTVDGRVAGTWTRRRTKGRCKVTVVPLVDLSRAQIVAVRAEAERTAAFCGEAGDRTEVALAV